MGACQCYFRVVGVAPQRPRAFLETSLYARMRLRYDWRCCAPNFNILSCFVSHGVDQYTYLSVVIFERMLNISNRLQDVAVAVVIGSCAGSRQEQGS